MGKRLFLAAATLLAVGVFVVSAASAGGSTRCEGAEGPVTITGDVTAGPGCNLWGTTVEGNVTVEPGGSPTTREGTTTVITDNVQSSKATFIELEGKTSIGGNLQLTGTTQHIEIFFGTVKGNIEIQNGIAYLSVKKETIDGNVQLQNNTGRSPVTGEGDVDIADSTVGGNVQLSNNSLTGSPSASVPESVLFAQHDSVGGNVQVDNNSLTGNARNEVVVAFSSVHGNVQVHNNSLREGSARYVKVVENSVEANVEVNNNIEQLPGEIQVFGNSVTNNLQCQDNEPPPADLGKPNKAKQKQGQCETL